MQRSFLLTLFGGVFFCTSALHTSPATADDTAITIYSKAQPGAIDASAYRDASMSAAVPGYAVVREQREIELPAKSNNIKFTDVAALIDPTTVQFKSLTAPNTTKVGEQSYQFDLISQQKLLEKYIDRKISVERQLGDKTETVEGTLLSTEGGLTLKTVDGSLKSISQYSSVNFQDVPGGLITKPTLVWNIFTDSPGKHKSEVSYQTRGITWWADYNITYHEGKTANTGTADFTSWVSIINQTGASFTNAKLKLMAGDVQQISAPTPMMARATMEKSMVADAVSAPAFAEKAFFEYHLYTLDQPVTLPNNATKQMELIPAAHEVPVEKLMVYDNTQNGVMFYPGVVYTDRAMGAEMGNKKIDVFLKFLNKKERGLGVPLPAGRIRVNQRDADGSLEFIGEDRLDHTPTGEEVLVKLGEAFDVVGERHQRNYTLESNGKNAEEEIELHIRNQKKQAVQVKIIEPLYRASDWKIKQSSIEYRKDNDHQISFMLEIPPEQEKIVSYTVRYHWQ